ncbi:MAG: Crp/Fnr family transcriptional regulator [bacterium]|nr:Crp/Fnr family transcriptional regulator [bacterium]
MIPQTLTNLLQQSLPFYHNLTASERELLVQHATLANYQEGQSLHFGNNDCIGLLVIKSGSIRTYLLSEEGREVTLYRLGENEVCILSASCVLKTITFDVFIEAESDCEILAVPSSVFLSLSTNNIYVEAYMYKLATERFSDVMWTMQQILFTSFDKRLAAFLLDETIKEQSDTLTMTHEQIAKYLGSAREVVSRMLKYFSTEGILTLSRGKITILDKKKLRSLL